MTYTTIQGDTWDAIAWKTMGNEFQSAALMRRNPAFLRFFVFPAGIPLEIPETAENVSENLPPWKRASGNAL